MSHSKQRLAEEATPAIRRVQVAVIASLGRETALYARDPSKKALHFNLFHSELNEVIARSRSGDSVAQEAALDIADVYVRRGQSMPLQLQQYLAQIARTPPTRLRGRHSIANLHRDKAIFRAVEAAIEAGAQISRNNASNRNSPSACSIVASALAPFRININAKAVEKIWRKGSGRTAADGLKPGGMKP